MSDNRQSNWRQGLFDPKSDVCHTALEELAVVLDQLGFKVRKKSPEEATLRVYIGRHNRYPLLNPRLQADAVYRGRRRAGGFLVINVLSKGDDSLDERLRRFKSNHEVEFVAVDDDSDGYHYHGQFVIPLAGAITSDGSVELSVIAEQFREVARACEGP